MLTITAIIRARPQAQNIVRNALLSVVEAVRETEPQTVGYYVAQSADDQCVFTTFERFVDAAAMESHNASAAVARSYAIPVHISMATWSSMCAKKSPPDENRRL